MLMYEIEALSLKLDEAAQTATPIPQAGPELREKDAYAVQAATIARRIERGERRIGFKMGFTSRAKMLQMGVHDVICGQLTDAMLVEEGGSIGTERYIHPRVEPEIAFLMRGKLAGTVTALEAKAAVEAVAPAMEIIDSRYRQFKFTLGDVIADNASACGVVIGPWAGRDTDIGNLGMVLSFDGEPVQIGSSAAILGNPLRALVAAARLAARTGESLQAGDIVLAGAATPAEPLRPGTHVRVEVQWLGSAEFSISP